MPELPEVETVKRTLEPLLGLKVERAWTSQLKLRHNVSTQTLNKLFSSKVVTKVERLGKYLLIFFDGSKRGLLVHLGMSGRLRLFAKDAEKAKHTHMILGLSKTKELRYSDPRRFGILDTFDVDKPKENKYLSKLGIDALEGSFSVSDLHKRLQAKRSNIKSILLDQGLLCGIGNIYACEALWIAKVHPKTEGYLLSKQELKRVMAGIQKTLSSALVKGGTSLRDFVNADGHKGENIHYLNVYGRTGQPCPRCKAPIVALKISNRSTFLCSICQKPKANS